jgi:ATP-binding cassette subfamily A (ABC1) protein 3
LAPIAFINGLTVLSNVESVDEGISASNVWEEKGGFNFGTALLMLMLDFFLYTLLGMYFDQVLPKEFGIVRPWYFPFQPSYWMSKR